MFKRVSISLLIVAGMLACCASAYATPGWEAVGRFDSTNLAPGSNDALDMFVYNIGAGAGAPTVTVTLPQGVTATEVEGVYCSGSSVVICTLPSIEGVVPFEFGIPVHVASTLAEGSKDSADITVAGGGALAVAHNTVPVTFSSAESPYGLDDLDGWFSNENGTIDTQAGSHPYELSVVFAMNVHKVEKGAEEIVQPSGGQPRLINVNLPPGIVGNATVAPRCTQVEFESSVEQGCPADTIIGHDSAIADYGKKPNWPVYNLVPPPGVAAQFGFYFLGDRVVLDGRVRSGGDSGITEHSTIPANEISYNTFTAFGNPSQHGVPAPSAQFLTLPTSCASPQEFTAELLGSWEDNSLGSVPAKFLTHNQEDLPTGFTGCEKLAHFDPTVSLAPDTSFADTPAGLSTIVRVPTGQNPEELATSGLKNTVVVLPEGVAINPGQATGLVACQTPEEDLGGNDEAYDGPPTCPAASKVGTDEISTPLLPDRLKGNVYVLQKNPPNLELLVAASGDGVNLKLVGTVHLNEQTGQLMTTFEKTPDAPLNEFVLNFSGGPQAALVTPSYCGTYTSTADFTPWASPFVSEALVTSRFVISAGPGGSACNNPLPFTPTMTAGATTDQAGGYTNFTVLLTRNDGQQHIEKLQFKTPEGLLGMIAKVPLCPEPQAAQGECSSASQIGHTVAEVGPGPYPFVIPEPGAPAAPIYLTGPYKGAPFGLSIVVPVVAGPFNLGNEVVRAKIEVDPRTSQLTIDTTAFPRTVKGIPTDIRQILAVIDRHEFMFNPTDCNPSTFSGTAYSFEGATAALSSHFQMGSCQALKFQPNFQVSTSGKTSRTKGASLDAKIVYPVGNLGFNQASSQSNINSIKVDLPKQLPSRLTTLQKACPAATFQANPASCPAASVVGHARALTPVLPVPLEGPAYFVSHAGEEFPSLIMVLQGYGVTVELVGSTFINSKTNITSSTFKNVPDVPIASFELILPQGKYSALAANGNLCKTKLTMPTAFTGQNGATLKQSTPINVTGCTKTKAKKKTKHKKSKSGKVHKAKKK
jgi:hypothetical protein